MELQGRPVTNGNWDECWRKLYSKQPVDATNGFTRVKIPVRIGEHHQLNDGVMFWWEWQQETEGDNNSLQIEEWYQLCEKTTPPCLETFLDDAPRHLGLLINPLGRVHITSGVLPVKSIDLPAVHYQDALGRMAGSLFAGPVITPQNELAMPQPAVIRHQWKWIGPPGEDPCILREPRLWKLPESLEIREGWLRLEKQRTMKPRTPKGIGLNQNGR